jgi:hypothetical protein
LRKGRTMTHVELDIDTPQWLIGALTDFLGAASGDLAWSSPQSRETVRKGV